MAGPLWRVMTGRSRIRGQSFVGVIKTCVKKPPVIYSSIFYHFKGSTYNYPENALSLNIIRDKYNNK